MVETVEVTFTLPCSILAVASVPKQEIFST